MNSDHEQRPAGQHPRGTTAEKQQQAYERALRVLGVPPGVEAPLSIVDILIGQPSGSFIEPARPCDGLDDDLNSR